MGLPEEGRQATKITQVTTICSQTNNVIDQSIILLNFLVHLDRHIDLCINLTRRNNSLTITPFAAEVSNQNGTPHTSVLVHTPFFVRSHALFHKYTSVIPTLDLT